MKIVFQKWKMSMAVMIAVLFFSLSTVAAGPPEGNGPPDGGGESIGNNLSFPVIWSEGVPKNLPGETGMTPDLSGPWWYQWGTNGSDPNIVPASCPPDPDEDNLEINPTGIPLCDDGDSGSVDFNLEAGTPPAQNPQDLVKAYLQKETTLDGLYNEWQAGWADWSGPPVEVDWVDWGDNLESVDWYTRSQVRTEVVLFQDLGGPMQEYEMRHTSGWGIDEVHGLAAAVADNAPINGPGTRATVYSPCARLIIQRLLVQRDELELDPDLITWTPEEGWSDTSGADPPEFVNPPIFNMAVHEAQDGPGYYNAEINVKGRIIYGYTWNVRRLNDAIVNGGEAAGDYRITFSFDEECGFYNDQEVSLNTFFEDGITQIMIPIEEVVTSESEPGGGATGVLVPAEYDELGNLVGGNFTYIDVRILERSGGGGGGGQGG